MPNSDRITKWPAVMLPKRRTASAKGLTSLPMISIGAIAIDIATAAGPAHARDGREDRLEVALGPQLDHAADFDNEQDHQGQRAGHRQVAGRRGAAGHQAQEIAVQDEEEEGEDQGHELAAVVADVGQRDVLAHPEGDPLHRPGEALRHARPFVLPAPRPGRCTTWSGRPAPRPAAGRPRAWSGRSSGSRHRYAHRATGAGESSTPDSRGRRSSTHPRCGAAASPRRPALAASSDQPYLHE